MTELFGDLASVMPLLWVGLTGLVLLLADAFVKERAELGMMTFVILLAAGGLSLGLWD